MQPRHHKGPHGTGVSRHPAQPEPALGRHQALLIPTVTSEAKHGGATESPHRTHMCARTLTHKHVSPCPRPQQLSTYNNHSAEKTSPRPPRPCRGGTTQRLTAEHTPPPPHEAGTRQTEPDSPGLPGQSQDLLEDGTSRLCAWLPSLWTGPPSGGTRPGARVCGLPQTPSSTRAGKRRRLSSRRGLAHTEHACSPGRKCGFCTSGHRSAPKAPKIAQQRTHVSAPSTHLATDWMTLEEVPLMLVKRRSVPPRRMSRSPP